MDEMMEDCETEADDKWENLFVNQWIVREMFDKFRSSSMWMFNEFCSISL